MLTSDQQTRAAAALLIHEIAALLSTPEKRIVISLAVDHEYDYRPDAPGNTKLTVEWSVHKQYDSLYASKAPTLNEAIIKMHSETPLQRKTRELEYHKRQVKDLRADLRRSRKTH